MSFRKHGETLSDRVDPLDELATQGRAERLALQQSAHAIERHAEARVEAKVVRRARRAVLGWSALAMSLVGGGGVFVAVCCAPLALLGWVPAMICAAAGLGLATATAALASVLGRRRLERELAWSRSMSFSVKGYLQALGGTPKDGYPSKSAWGDVSIEVAFMDPVAPLELFRDALAGAGIANKTPADYEREMEQKQYRAVGRGAIVSSTENTIHIVAQNVLCSLDGNRRLRRFFRKVIGVTALVDRRHRIAEVTLRPENM
jgi:hypothetical protein